MATGGGLSLGVSRTAVSQVWYIQMPRRPERWLLAGHNMVAGWVVHRTRPHKLQSHRAASSPSALPMLPGVGARWPAHTSASQHHDAGMPR